ncbi:hypothetical protein Gorai_002729 [Gossypium raimondii]|uniref:Leucine-rich repeat-containing N-terminal plant-type domain-containing protein n=1 Tax=Gossypium raimondii TaxID=29730 RepID=A0A7J8QLV3_GOSRA|nr:hypothetical protein [Gossypium raimondii]
MAVNYFSSNISPGLGTCSSLEQLLLGRNDLRGGITIVPDNLPSCRQLKDINLARNNCNGQIPESFKEFHSLSYLSLSNASLRNLSSALQILNQCRNLTTLVLTLNFRDETLSDLKGSIPLWFKRITALQLLDLSWNHLVGKIPPWFGSYRDLFYLDLPNNLLTGDIPKSLTKLPGLIHGNISLEEPSPEFGNLRMVHVFDLRFNNFSRPIPINLFEMINLGILDLSHNNLSGTIPSSLQSLSFLSFFSVAYNQLYGRIPYGGQFQTFPSSRFEGNCGDPRSRCHQDRHESPKRSRRNTSIIIGLVIGIVCGTIFLVGLIILIALRAKKSRRGGPQERGA